MDYEMRDGLDILVEEMYKPAFDALEPGEDWGDESMHQNHSYYSGYNTKLNDVVNAIMDLGTHIKAGLSYNVFIPEDEWVDYLYALRVLEMSKQMISNNLDDLHKNVGMDNYVSD